MNILILTGKFGMGHYSVANTLVQEIERNIPNAETHIQDIFDYTNPFLAKTVYHAYTLLLNKGSKIYNFFYKKFDENKKLSGLPIPFPYLISLDHLIEEYQPDMILSTLPFCSQLVSEYKEKSDSKLPLITCITDIGSHSEWITPQTDIYLVASDLTQQELEKKGIPKKQIIINGIPVQEQFKQKVPLKRFAQK